MGYGTYGPPPWKYFLPWTGVDLEATLLKLILEVGPGVVHERLEEIIIPDLRGAAQILFYPWMVGQWYWDGWLWKIPTRPYPTTSGFLWLPCDAHGCPAVIRGLCSGYVRPGEPLIMCPDALTGPSRTEGLVTGTLLPWEFDRLPWPKPGRLVGETFRVDFQMNPELLESGIMKGTVTHGIH